MDGLLNFLNKRVSASIGIAIVLASSVSMVGLPAYSLVQEEMAMPFSYINLKKEVSAHLGKEFKIKFGREAVISPEGIKIKFLNVTEDSRCPIDVQCVRQGQATVALDVLKNNQNIGEVSLTSQGGNENLAIKEFNGYSLKLIKLDPYPVSSQQIKEKDYIATLLVSFQDEAETWKTYQGKRIGFSIKYPGDWQVGSEAIIYTTTEVELSKGKDIRVVISSGNRFNDDIGAFSSLKDWITSRKMAIRRTAPLSEIKEINIPLSDTQAMMLSYKDIDGNVIYSIYAEKEGIIYEITAEINAFEDSLYTPIFYQMLSTFQFL